MPIQLNNIRIIRAQLKLRAVERKNHAAIAAEHQPPSSEESQPNPLNLGG